MAEKSIPLVTAKSQEELSLVIRKRREILTTSLIVAKRFEKRHDNVIQRIEKLSEEDESGRLNFKESYYLDSQNKTQKMYEMDKHSFIILAMRFTGKPALKWQHQFVDQFETMERIVLQQQNEAWNTSRVEGKKARFELTDEIKDFIEYSEAQGSRNAKMYYMSISKMTNKALFMIVRKAPQCFRDMLDMMELNFLQTAEFVARNAIREGMGKGMFYKDIYSLARDKVTAFALTVGQIPILDKLFIGTGNKLQ